MRNLNYLSLILFCICALFSCKKNEIIGGKSHAALITGKWLAYQQHTMIYDLNTADLVKDTTMLFSSTNPKAWYEIFNDDGSAYITTIPHKVAGSSVYATDSTSYLHYTILGSVLTVKQNGGGSETDPIIRLTDTDLGLETIFQSNPQSGWGLDVNTSYKYIVDTYYSRQ
ncbi:hypothetical protein [Mucilaginibacter sp.]|uniref:hypothetical protein n=1 Tax=Mucilaginibacter sp. TaxID=1882438 RepID=UPI002614EB94|nr:hypothetical protein [Mucilaginibacter sp.]MDB5030856.1 hypothetical protein [Mucilaginibacter sp.]